MRKVSQLFLFVFFLGLVSSCAHAPVISPDLRAKVDPSLTFTEVLQNSDAYKGKMVLWGGEILQVVPQDETTVVEVLQMPLDENNKPKKVSASQGKFFILFRQYMDFSPFEKGRKITAAGEILGTIQEEKFKYLGGITQPYPVVLSEEIHLWKKHYYPYSSVPNVRGTWGYREYEGILRY